MMVEWRHSRGMPRGTGLAQLVLMTITALQAIPYTQAIPHSGDEPLLSGRTPRRPLSPREKEILDLVNSGRTQKEVAFELGLSAATVRVLHSRAMAKLGRAKRSMARRSE
jgi:DNA-binding NarL/FixJ family response regulator